MTKLGKKSEYIKIYEGYYIQMNQEELHTTLKRMIYSFKPEKNKIIKEFLCMLVKMDIYYSICSVRDSIILLVFKPLNSF